MGAGEEVVNEKMSEGVKKRKLVRNQSVVQDTNSERQHWLCDVLDLAFNFCQAFLTFM